MIQFNYFTYALMNTIIFLPYFLFTIIGNSYDTSLHGGLPLIIFYTFKYTGGIPHSFVFPKSEDSGVIVRLSSRCNLRSCLRDVSASFTDLD